MPVLRYWDATQGAYVNAPAVPGPQGAVGPQGTPGVFPVDTVQPAMQNIYPGGTTNPSGWPPGTRTKLYVAHGTVTPDSTGKATLTLSTYGIGPFQYGYIPVINGAIIAGGTSTGFTCVTAGSSLTQLVVYVWNANAAAITTLTHFMLWCVGA